MPNILELEENRIYVENEKWSCRFGYGEPVKLGLVLEAIENEYFLVIDAHIIPQPEHLEKGIVEQAIEEGASSREDLIRYAHECYSGVPVNIEVEVRHFQDRDDAMKFARDVYAIYASGLFGFIDMVLDNPLRSGGTGWDKIREMARL